jgi:hypothetical protein
MEADGHFIFSADTLLETTLTQPRMGGMMATAGNLDAAKEKKRR